MSKNAAWLVAFCVGMRVAIPGGASGVGLETLVTTLPIGALLGLLAFGAANRRLELPSALCTLPFVGLAGWTLVACAWAPAPYAAFSVAVQRSSEAALVALALLSAAAPGGRRQVVAVLAGLAAMSATYALAQWVWIQPRTVAAFEQMGFIDRVPEEERAALLSRLGSNRSAGTFAIANTLAGFLVMTLPIFVAGLLGAVGRAHRAGAATLVGLALLGLASSGSKGGFVALALVGGALAWGGSWRRRGLILGVATAAFLVALALPRLADALEGSASVRLGYWQTAIHVCLEAPVQGVGPGQFDDGFFRHKTPEVEETRHAHNTYLEVAAETGVIGLVVFLAAWLGPLVAGWRVQPKEGAEDSDGWQDTYRAVPISMYGGVCMAILWGGVLSAEYGADAVAQGGLRLALLVVAGLAYAFTVRIHVPRRMLAIGCLGLLAHAAIDFDLQVPGLAAAGVTLIALAAPPSRTHIWEPLSTRAMSVLIPITLVSALVVLRWVGVQDFLADGGRPQFLEAKATSQAEIQRRLDACNLAAKLCPLDPALPRRQSHLLRGLGRERKARDAAKRALELDPLDPGLLFEVAQLTRSRELMQRAVAAYDANPRFHFALADMLSPLTEAAEHYRAALDRDSRLYDRNRLRLGLSQEQRKRAESRSR